MEKRIIYTDPETGILAVLTPAPDWAGTLEELAAKDVPPGVEYRIVDVDRFPLSRNWRNAWTDDNPTETVDVDFDKAKQAHRQLIIRKAHERIKPDTFNRKDFSQVEAQLNALDIDGVNNLQELYNLWPDCINLRKGEREYKQHAEIQKLREAL